MKKIALILALGFMLSACGSNSEDSESSDDSSSSGGYLNCVLEYTKLRNEGVITATDSEITSECASSSLP
jgi:starvation-inducible outer membrane lipoprotein